MIANLLDFVFGCYHPKLSFPMTARAGQRRSPAASLTGTYIVCLDCGKEFPYDWQQMRVLSAPGKSRGRLAAALESYAGK
jgi:hypothetical protein